MEDGRVARPMCGARRILVQGRCREILAILLVWPEARSAAPIPGHLRTACQSREEGIGGLVAGSLHEERAECVAHHDVWLHTPHVAERRIGALKLTKPQEERGVLIKVGLEVGVLLMVKAPVTVERPLELGQRIVARLLAPHGHLRPLGRRGRRIKVNGVARVPRLEMKDPKLCVWPRTIAVDRLSQLLLITREQLRLDGEERVRGQEDNLLHLRGQCSAVVDVRKCAQS
mmetsp:Transcript_23571/g.72103  ORF Transcript_23571/g.72103 Transcript_23571/m.72103 type:complete len:230 (-) Transcript_23571:172-861(-)|eukprot:scaffold117386_cov39-Tisochrysis_lutea.AAC.3